MKIMFVNPEYSSPYSDWDMSDLKSSSPPLGLLSLAAVARKFGHKVSICDRTVGDDTTGCDLIAITAMTLQIDNAAKFVKESSGIPNVLGGPHASADAYNTTLRYPQFDDLIVGEGETQFSNYLGDSFHMKELDDLPFPAFDLVDLRKYQVSPIGTRRRNAVGLVTSRGCFGRCEFCSKAVFGNRMKCHSARYVIDLMDSLHKDFHVSDFLFYDDLFVGNKPRLREICELLMTRKYHWSCCSRVDVLDSETLQLMKRAGCLMIEFGIESGSEKILGLMRKGITKDQAREAIARTRKAGILSKGNFIFGYFGETEDTMAETIEFIKTLDLDYFQHTFMTPLPGTPAWDKASQFGSFDKDWAKCNTFSVNFIPHGFTRKRLLELSKLAFRAFYLRPLIMLKEALRGAFLSKIRAFWKTLCR